MKKTSQRSTPASCPPGRSLTLGLVYDLRDDYLAEGFTEEQVAEFDSVGTIVALEQTLQSLGYATERIGSGLTLAGQLAAGKRWDLVFNFAEGVRGRSREAQVPALLEMYGVRYTFSDPLVCALTLDKAMTKRVIQSAGLHTPRFCVVSSSGDIGSVDLEFPSSPSLWRRHGQGRGRALADRIRGGLAKGLRPAAGAVPPAGARRGVPARREFTTALLGTGRDAAVLGTMEITIREDAPATDYSYEVKELCEQFVHYFPMPQGTLREEVEGLALRAYQVLECRDTGRVDIRLDARGRPAFIEINPLPGIHPTHSDLPMIATQEAWPTKSSSVASFAAPSRVRSPCRAASENQRPDPA